MYNDGHEKHSIKNIVYCNEVTYEKYCKNREIYEKTFYDIMLTVDMLKSCDIEAVCNGKLYRISGNVLRIRRENSFSRISANEPFEKWYLLSVFCDIVKGKSGEYFEIVEKVYALADEKPVVKISDDDAAYLAALFAQLREVPVNEYTVRDSLSKEVLKVIIEHFNRAEKVEGVSLLLRNEIIDRVIDYIKTHIDSNLTVDEIADACYLDKFYLSKLFKKCTDYTINQFVTVYRVMHSIKYLFDGYSVQAAGKACGFKNTETYIKAFKIVNYNITPKQFIKREMQ